MNDKLNIDIDLKINDWLINIPEHNRHEIINKNLKLGHIISSLLINHIDVSNDIFNPIHDKLSNISNIQYNQLDKINTQINENLNFVKDSIDKLTQYSNKSVTKGFYGEKIIENLIKYNFPDYTIINNTHNPHNSDYELINLKQQKILIEIKNYTRNIPTTEINKFIDDLQKSDIQIGIFISLNTGICNKKRFTIETYDNDKKIIFLPNVSENSTMIIMSILLAESLFDINNYSHKKINENNINIIYDDFNSFCKKYNDIIENIKLTKINIEKILLQQYNLIIDNDLKIKNYLKNIKIKLENELFSPKYNFIDFTYDKIENIINDINDINIKKIYYDLYQIIVKNKFNVQIDENNIYHWYINNNYEINLNKKKVLLIFDNNNITVNNSNIFNKLFL